MAPGIDGLPAAEREVDVSAPVARFLATTSPRVLTRLRLGLRAFEWLPFPWRFSRLDPAAQADFLHRLERSRLSLHHDLLLMAKLFSTLGYAVTPRVQARIGFEVGCGLADGGLPEPAGSLGETEPRGEGEECDVLMVGSGAGGAVAAATLAEAGLDVLVLEAGGHYDRDSYPGDHLEAIAELYRDAGLTIAEGRPPIPVPVAKVVGGTTVINSGTCFRAPDQILEDWRHRFGIGWAGDLDADFAEAEETLRVTQLDPERMGRNGQLAMEGAAAIGASGAPIFRNAGSCVQCSSCPFGCEIDAKRGMHVSYLPRAVAAGARLRAGVEARRVLVEDGRAVGVECAVAEGGSSAAGHGRRFTVRARRAVIVAGGALGTPELLLRSGPRRPPGRPQPPHPPRLLGRRPLRGGGARLGGGDAELLRRPVGAPADPARGDLHPARLRRRLAARRRRRATSGRCSTSATSARSASTSATSSAGRVGLGAEGSLRASYRLTDDDARRLAFGIARAAEIHFAAGATEVYPTSPGSGC